MKARRKFDKTYHNNEFNYLISQHLDLKRSVMDIDCVLTRFNCDSFLIDHKKSGDMTSINTIRTLSNYVGVQLNDKTRIKCFIVRSDIDTDKCETIDGVTLIYEIKSYNEVKDKKNKKEFVKAIYRTTNDNELKLFFQQETHEQIKHKLKIN